MQEGLRREIGSVASDYAVGQVSTKERGRN
jgi:hypothetical protein